MSYWRTSVLAVVVAGVLLVAGGAQAAPPALDLTVAATGLSGPVHIASTPADATAIYVVEQGGRIRRVVSGVTDPEPFLDISSKISFGGERGLLSMAFPPGYARGGSYFVYYTAKNGALKVDMVTPRPGKSPKLKSLLNVAHPKYSNHNGGQLQFTPDGTLYAGTGDGGSGGDPKNNAQNPKKLLGKLLRAFGPKYNKWTIVGHGLRNPWRFSFDSSTGDLFIGDVGQGAKEEVDRRLAADLGNPANYGWRRYEGLEDYDTETVLKPPGVPYVAPVLDFDHGDGYCAIIGGYVYRGADMTNEVGRYFFTDLCTGEIQTMLPDGTDWRVEDADPVGNPSSFGVDAAGELYVASLGTGEVYRLSES